MTGDEILNDRTFYEIDRRLQGLSIIQEVFNRWWMDLLMEELLDNTPEFLAAQFEKWFYERYPEYIP